MESPAALPVSKGRGAGSRVTGSGHGRSGLTDTAPAGMAAERQRKGYGLSLREMNRTALCNTAPSSATLGFLCPAPAAWKTVWGKIFQSIHIFSIKTQALSPTSTKALRSPVFQRPRSHCGFGPEDLNLIEQLIEIRSPRHF